MIRRLRKFVCVLVISCSMLILCSCQEAEIRHLLSEVNTVQSQVATVAQAIGKAEYGDNELLNFFRAAQAGNIASAPVNPYVLPIGAGLSGIIALLEALRRNEKGKRQYAEHELRNNNKKANNG